MYNLIKDKFLSVVQKENFLNKQECEEIILLGKQKGLNKGLTPDNYSRDSLVSWLHSGECPVWLLEKLNSFVTETNNLLYKLDLSGFTEKFQFTNYIAPSGKFQKHVDRYLNGEVRKLSISIQLSNFDEYEGGELITYEDGLGRKANKQQGNLIMFPSFILHEVTPITKGERNSLVIWVSGKPFI
jgi:PKHD-type hydroxylase